MLKKYLTTLLAGAALALTVNAASATELTIFWAEWDPANYLQELVNHYTAETGVKVTVETTPWADFQTKAFTEFNAKATPMTWWSATSQWLGAGSTGGHYVDLTDFFNKHKLTEVMAPATVKYYAEYPGNSGKYWAIPLEGDAAAGPIARTGSKTRRRWQPSRPNTATTSACRRTTSRCATSPSSSIAPTRRSYGIAHLHRQLLRRDGHGRRERRSSAMAATSATIRPTRSTASSIRRRTIAALQMYKDLFKFTPPGWGKTFFVEDNQAITENLAAMSMNFFAFFPALANPATNPNANNTGFFANPAGPGGDQLAALGGQGISIVSYSKNKDEAMKFLEWFITRRRPEEVGRARRLHLQRGGAPVGRVPQRHALQRGLLRVHVHGEGLLGDAGICRAARADQQPPLSVRRRRRGHRQGSARRLAADWNGDLQEIRPRQIAPSANRDRRRRGLLRSRIRIRIATGRKPLAVHRARLDTRYAGGGARDGATSPSAISSSFRRSLS